MHSCVKSQFPKSVKRFSDKNCGKNKELERLTEPSEVKTALASPEMPIHVPAWFFDMLETTYGKATAQAIIRAQMCEPPLDITVKTQAVDWAAKLSGRVFSHHTTVRLTALKQNLTQLPGFSTGEWWVQDVAASLPVLLMGNVKNKKIADLCAAPGGKTAQLVQLGADVTAFDCSNSRMQRLLDNMQRLKLNVKTHVCDIRQFNPPQLFDAVLCDAPCSSTGTVRRHPDILWTKSRDDIDRLAKLQTELLEAGLRFTKPGGTIIFSNCSLSTQEGEEMINHFLEQHNQVKLIPIQTEELPDSFASLITRQGFLRSTPADLIEFGGMDGFFAARLIKL